jgi:predicted DCC family thiol-disulfide oxidoreductase YuxK
MDVRAPVDVLYDGECRFCLRSLRVLQRFDAKRRLRLMDGNDTDRVRREFPQVPAEDLAAAMYAVAEGIPYRGFYAFRRALWALPALRPLAAMLYLPGVPFAGERVYASVARRRRLFGCSSDACSLPGR